MKSVFALTILVLLGAALSEAFVVTTQQKLALTSTRTPITALHGFMGEPERDGLTRDSEPEEFFATNTDKMSDEDKLPIAIAGVAAITIPFIAGLIALYAAKY
eukprot:CAMPEP_0198146992 /NCGR_PEP_ID=MMETSP1443-20131203/32671_1 /TAXON_ID=186043 /ORGANISM="Entomoneis sp., Strain CCMP2396" /LENGTH=102 /DNA_ID=CAMNT_0043811115 /DNA_START=119 /DNA_END=427 /DNA_ORIENTATION=-